MVVEDQAHIEEACQYQPSAVLFSDNEAVVQFGFGGFDVDFDTLDFRSLISTRQRHETKQAIKGIRTSTATNTSNSGTDKDTLRQQLIKKFHEILKKKQAIGAGTGCERAARWRAPAPGGREGVVDSANATSLAGNSANAATVASSVAKKACR